MVGYKCDFCEFISLTKLGLVQHKTTRACYDNEYDIGPNNEINKERSTEQVQKYQESILHCCTICPKKYKNKVSLKCHQDWHAGRFKCVTCGLSCPSKTSLGIHIRSHTGERPFACQLCSATFKQKDNLKRHTVFKHTTARPTQVCYDDEDDIGSNNETNKKLSTEQVQKDQELILHCCTICPKKYKRKSSLKQHQDWHAGRFKCGTCSLSCSSKFSLDMHSRIHTGERPFVCQLCSATFKRKEGLELHTVSKHTTARPRAERPFFLNRPQR